MSAVTTLRPTYAGLRQVHSRVARAVLPRVLRATLKPLWASERVSVPVLRGVTGALLHHGWIPRAAVLSHRVLAGRETEQWAPRAGAGSETVFFVHGGGYVVCSPRTHRPLTSRLAVTLNATVVVPSYRLAPEHPFPAGLDDIQAAYLDLLATGVDPARLTVAGDSAGGGMALALALRLRDAGLPLPARLILISPWTDLTLSGESLARCDKADHMLSQRWIQAKTPLYVGTQDPRHPHLSPLFGDFQGLPPTLVQTGTEEILLSDSTRLAERAQAAGWPLTLQLWQGMWHDFQMLGDLLPEADEALLAMRRFVTGA